MLWYISLKQDHEGRLLYCTAQVRFRINLVIAMPNVHYLSLDGWTHLLLQHQLGRSKRASTSKRNNPAGSWTALGAASIFFLSFAASLLHPFIHILHRIGRCSTFLQLCARYPLYVNGKIPFGMELYFCQRQRPALIDDNSESASV